MKSIALALLTLTPPLPALVGNPPPQNQASQPSPPPPILFRPEPRGNPQLWFSDKDYPAAARHAGAHGITAFQLEIDATGTVTGCTITASSGSPLLDATVCTLLKRRARFTSARGADRAPVASVWNSHVVWVRPRH